MGSKSLKATLLATFAIIAAANVAQAQSHGNGGGGQGGSQASSSGGPGNSGTGLEITHLVPPTVNAPAPQPTRRAGRSSQRLPFHCADAILGFYTCVR